MVRGFGAKTESSTDFGKGFPSLYISIGQNFFMFGGF